MTEPVVDPQVTTPPVGPPEDSGGSRRADLKDLVRPLIYDQLASTWDEIYPKLTGQARGAAE